jgi:hypothetical protein
MQDRRAPQSLGLASFEKDAPVRCKPAIEVVKLTAWLSLSKPK